MKGRQRGRLGIGDISVKCLFIFLFLIFLEGGRTGDWFACLERIAARDVPGFCFGSCRLFDMLQAYWIVYLASYS